MGPGTAEPGPDLGSVGGAGATGPAPAAVAALSEEDHRHLARAVALGRRGWGRVHPNPMVGCVLVRDGQVVGEGWHEEWGGGHAEVNALAAAGAGGARGATAYVSLEPCRHEGKTPPCTRALQEAGVRRVVYGARDPGERSGGGGLELVRAGMEVVGPVFDQAKALRENPGFFHRNPARPWICLKLAISLDGAIAAEEGERTAVTGPEVAREVHRLRAGMDAVLVGGRTAQVDDPLLTVRLGGVEPRVPPVRVVLDGRGVLPVGARLLAAEDGPVHIITTAAAPRAWQEALVAREARVTVVPGRDGRVSLPSALHVLRAEGIRTLLCEGGGRMAAALLHANVVDRLHLAMAPRFFGQTGVPAFPWPLGSPMAPWTGSDHRRSAFSRAPGRHRRTRGTPRDAWEHLEPPRMLGKDLWMILERKPDLEEE